MLKKYSILVLFAASMLAGCHDLNIKDADTTTLTDININVSDLTHHTSLDFAASATINYPKGTVLQFIVTARNDKGGIKNLFLSAVDQPLFRPPLKTSVTGKQDTNGNISTQLAIATYQGAAITNKTWNTSSIYLLGAEATNFKETTVKDVVLTINIPADLPQPTEPTLTITEFKVEPAIGVYPNENFTTSWSYQKNGDNGQVDVTITKKYFQEPEMIVYQSLDAPLTGSAQLPSGPSGFPDFKMIVRYHAKPNIVAVSPLLNRHIQPATPNNPVKPYLVILGPTTVPALLFEKELFTISYDCFNAGSADLPAFDVDLKIDGIKEGNTQTVGKLSPAAKTTITWNVSNEILSGFHSFDIFIAGTTNSLSHNQWLFSTK